MLSRVNRKLRTLIEFGRAVASSVRLREDDVLKLIYSKASELMDTDNMYIALYDETSDTVRFPLAFKYGKPLDVETRKAGQGRTEWIIQNREPIFVKNQEESITWYEQPGHKEYIDDPLASWLGVPMMVGKKVLGVVATYHPTQDDVYDQQDLKILQSMASQTATAIQNARLYDRLNHKIKDLDAVNQIGQELTAGIQLNEAEIINLIHNQASKLMDMDNMYIALYDEIMDTVRFPLVFQDGVPINVGTRKAGKGKTEEIIRTQKCLFHPTGKDAKEWYAKSEREEYIKSVDGSWLGVPMMVGKKVLGVVATYHPTQDYVYSNDDLEILQAMANQAAIALDNAHMFYNINQRREALVKFGRAITSGIRLEEDEILKLVHYQASELMDTDNMYIALYDEATDTVSFPLAFQDGVPIDIKTRKAGQGRTEWIIQHQEPVFIKTRNDSKAWYKQPGREEYINDPLASWLGVPMMVGEKVLGVIATYHTTQDYVYCGDDLEILQAIADQAAIALENARLYREAERLYKEARGEAIAAKQLATLGTAIAALQHRINNTFNIIVPNVTRLRKRVDMTNETIVEILEIIERNARYTSRIVERIQEPLSEVGLQDVDINAVLENVATTAKEQLRPEVDIKLDLDDSIPLIRAPIGQITEVFRNLTENGCRAMNEGQLIINSVLTDKGVSVRVKDTGPGIPPRIQERLFTKPVPSKEPGGGAGLGLWLSRLMLQTLGGDIRIEETGDTGTTMLVQIPVSGMREDI
ncbi:MAG: GAF domain-containing protein [Chloroflexota bacterium]|nr:GAF domain-containing protein [Chloroflexota bacterium]